MLTLVAWLLYASNALWLCACVVLWQRLRRLTAEARAVRSVIHGLAARVEAQAKLLARRAEK